MIEELAFRRREFLIKPKNDFVLKKIFEDERNKDLLNFLLNSILKEKINDVTLVNTEVTPNYYDSKNCLSLD